MMRFAVFTALLGVVVSDPVTETLVVPHEDIKIRLYETEKTYTAWTLGDAVKLFSHQSYISSLDLIMIILGYDNNQDDVIQQTVQVLFERGLDQEYNILAVDLPEQFSFNAMNLYYLRPAFNVPVAGEALGEFLNSAIDSGYVTLDKINLISYSLGAQIAGYVGRTVDGLIHSITGVDPAGLGFDLSTVVTRLVHVSREDARYVHLYHSNSVFMGSSLRLGTADFLFNGGNTQPTCNSFTEPLCSHQLGFVYYLEALGQEGGLPALQCNSQEHLIHCKCQGNRLSYVGFPLDTSAGGLYVLRTREGPPYALGAQGVVGTKCKTEKSDFSIKMGHKYDAMMNLL